MKRLVTPSARDDILRQYRYLLIEKDNPEAAQKFLTAVQNAIREICRQPGLGSPRALKNPKLAGLRSWHITGFSAFRVYYLVTASAVQIIRVLHGKRDIHPLLEEESLE